MWLEFPEGCLHVRSDILQTDVSMSMFWACSTMNTITYPWHLSVILLHCCLACTFLSLPGNNKWHQQLNVMNPISTSTHAPSLLKPLQSKNIECIDQQPFSFQYFRQKAREGRQAPGGIWMVKHKMEYFCGVYLWNVLAQAVGALTWIVLYAVEPMGQCKCTYSIKRGWGNWGGTSKQLHGQLLLVLMLLFKP